MHSPSLTLPEVQDTNITTREAAIAKHIRNGFHLVIVPSTGVKDEPPSVYDFWHQDEDTGSITEARFYRGVQVGSDRARRFYYTLPEDEQFIADIPRALWYLKFDFAAFGHSENRIVALRRVGVTEDLSAIASACDHNRFMFDFYRVAG